MIILIADSSAPIIERLGNMIVKENKEAIIYAATSFETALHVFNERKPLAVLLGMNLSGNGSIELLRAIKETGQTTNIIILSINLNDMMMNQCKSHGVTIFLDKFLEFEKIPGLLKLVAEKDSGEKLAKTKNQDTCINN